MYNLCGTFGPWELKTGVHEEKFLPQAAFHVYEKSPGRPPVVRTLATEDVLPAWSRLNPGDGRYFALYPQAWFVYYPFRVELSLNQFTPIIPHNYKESSYPVGVFKFRVKNPTTDTLVVGLLFTFPNAGYASVPRRGLVTFAWEEGNAAGVVLKASDPSNPPETQDTEWCIAAKGPANSRVTYTTSWDKDGDGSDIYGTFGDDGELNNGPIDDTGSGGAVAVKVTLAPGEEVEVPFVLAWNFPRVRFGEGTLWYRRYTEYVDLSSDPALQIAKRALTNLDQWKEAIDEWQSLIIDEPAYPDWLKQAALNELYYDTFGGVFWENGCITKPEESSYGSLPADDHKYFCMECQAYPMCETFDVRHYECRHYLVLWPEIERDVLRWFADYIANDPDGKAPHDAGRPDQDPFFRTSGYGTDWQDMPSRFIQQVYAYYATTRDEEFLNFVWPACKKTYNYMKRKDTNGNGLPDIGNTTYDTWAFKGDNLLAGCLWVGALEAMEQMAIHKGESGLLHDIRQRLSLARLALDALFWQEDKGYYRLDMASRAIMADGLNGQRYCETTGLDPVLPPERIASHLHKVFEMCVRPLRDYTGDGIGDMGAVNGRGPEGQAIGHGQPDEVWTGSSYFVAAMMYHWGKVLGDQQLIQEALQTAYGVYYQTWVNEETAYYFCTPEAWHYKDPRSYRALQYQRPRAVWELLLEIKNPFAETVGVGAGADQRQGDLPESFEVVRASPNPFQGRVRIDYFIAQPARVKIRVYDVRGRLVQTLLDSRRRAGRYAVAWVPSPILPNGVYICTLEVRSRYAMNRYAAKVTLMR